MWPSQEKMHVSYITRNKDDKEDEKQRSDGMFQWFQVQLVVKRRQGGRGWWCPMAVVVLLTAVSPKTAPDTPTPTPAATTMMMLVTAVP